jgi:hypothetical protein
LLLQRSLHRKLAMQMPAHRGQAFLRIADSNPVMAFLMGV